MGRLILIIDDDAAVRYTLAQILEKSGYEIQCAEEGRQGLQAFHTRRPDLVITDIIMPEMEGIETIIALRTLSTDCPIIAMSARARFGNANFLDMAQRLGANAVLSKPFEMGDLLRTVAGCLAGNFAKPAQPLQSTGIAA